MKNTLFLIFLMYSLPCAAMFCPKSFNQFNMGNSAQQVEAQCGKPDSIKAFKATNNLPQEWTYYMQLNPASPVTMKVTIAFVDDKINNITANGASIGATKICNKTTYAVTEDVRIGDSTEKVERSCGKPAVVTPLNLTNNPDQPGPKPVDFEEWTYNSSPPVTLVFKNGALVERR